MLGTTSPVQYLWTRIHARPMTLLQDKTPGISLYFTDTVLRKLQKVGSHILFEDKIICGYFRVVTIVIGFKAT